MISDVHAPTANATNRQTLEQRRAFSRWALAALWAQCVCVFPKSSLIALVFFPRDLTGIRTCEQGVPLLLRQFSLVDPAQSFASASFPVREGSWIARVMQHEQCFVEIQFLPQQLTVLRSTSQPAGNSSFASRKALTTAHAELRRRKD